MNSPMSDLKSLMEAEQELSSIFSKNKNPVNYEGYSMGASHALWSPDKNSSISTNGGFSEMQSINGQENTTFQVGFSKFGHFKAPIKRPKCNPILKDEKFRRLNIVNEGVQNQNMNNS